MATPHLPQNQITNDEHDSIKKAKRVMLVESDVTINPGDIKIGSVEIKDGDTEDKLVVNPDGSIEVNVKSNDSDLLANYQVNDVDEATSKITYVGKQRTDGEWVLQKIDETTGTVIRYANVSNNVLVTSYADAWTSRLTLTYSLSGDLTW